MRKPYTKGAIKRVKLVPDEAVMMMCKGTVMPGAFSNPVSCWEPAGGPDCIVVGS